MTKLNAVPMTLRLDALLEQLGKHPNIPPPVSYSGPSLPEIIVGLAKKCAADPNNCRRADVIADAAQHCLQVRSPDAALEIINSAITGDFLDLTRVDFKESVTALIRKLCQLGKNFQMLDAFAPAFQTIFVAWTEKVKEYSTLCSLMSQWASACGCSECTFVRACIESPKKGPKTKPAGGEEEKHINDHLRQYLPSGGVIVQRTHGSLSVRHPCLDIHLRY